jgi:hypothetical protein
LEIKSSVSRRGQTSSKASGNLLIELWEIFSVFSRGSSKGLDLVENIRDREEVVNALADKSMHTRLLASNNIGTVLIFAET